MGIFQSSTFRSSRFIIIHREILVSESFFIKVESPTLFKTDNGQTVFCKFCNILKSTSFVKYILRQLLSTFKTPIKWFNYMKKGITEFNSHLLSRKLLEKKLGVQLIGTHSDHLKWKWINGIHWFFFSIARQLVQHFSSLFAKMKLIHSKTLSDRDNTNRAF